ncbi:MAG: fibronectin type III domain-containing protein [Flavobacteriales bacterium]
MKANIKLELKTLTPTRLATLMGKVSDSMAGNAHFPHPPVPMDVLKARCAALWEAITEATDGSRVAKYKRDALVREAHDTLRRLANYVRMIALGDAAVLASSGFEPARTPQPIGVVGAPLIHEARMTGRRGEVLLRWSGVHGRRGYHIYLTDQDPAGSQANWTLIGITGKIMHHVTDLEPYKAYWFSVSAIGPLGESRKSDPALGRAA